jgi:hypothetical protein
LRADYAVVLDACVLANYGVCDLYLRLAEDYRSRMLLPKWSSHILDEVRTTQIEKLGWPEDLANHFRSELERNFPEALVKGFEPLIPACQNNPDDRHVLAAAIRAPVQTIVTFNLRHFRSEALEPWDIAAVHPGEYLIMIFSHHSAVVLDKLTDIAEKRGLPVEEVLTRLSRTVPTFAEHVASDLGWELNG